jgi:hypothetical protein
MNRRLIAALWIAGATIPLLAATLFVVGCCALPFHGVMHKVMPVCRMAIDAFRLDLSTPDGADQPATPAREKQEPVKIALQAAPSMRLSTTAATPVLTPLGSPAAYRSFITLGAVRCDRDVGLHLLVDTFRI